MPRYHFHVHDGVDRPDPDGRELPGIVAARAEALMLAGRISEGLELGHLVRVAPIAGEQRLQRCFLGLEFCGEAHQRVVTIGSQGDGDELGKMSQADQACWRPSTANTGHDAVLVVIDADRR